MLLSLGGPGAGIGDPEAIAASLRSAIRAATGCTASAGIGPNLLLARLATRQGKPDGQFRVKEGEASAFLAVRAACARACVCIWCFCGAVLCVGEVGGGGMGGNALRARRCRAYERVLTLSTVCGLMIC